MKFLLLASALIAATTAFSPLYHEANNFVFASEDGTMAFMGYHGYRIFFNRIVGLKHIEVTVSGPSIDTYTLQDSSSWDILYDILKQLQGVLDDVTYQKFLNKIEPYVQKGEISHVLYNLFVQFYKQQGHYYQSFPYHQEQQHYVPSPVSYYGSSYPSVMSMFNQFHQQGYPYSFLGGQYGQYPYSYGGNYNHYPYYQYSSMYPSSVYSNYPVSAAVPYYQQQQAVY